MADIAMLVAEEYERRVKNSRKSGGGEEEIDFLSGFSVVSQKLRKTCSLVLLVDDDREKKMMMISKILEPRTGFAVAARNGFFSA